MNLRSKIAYRLQELHIGGLNQSIKKTLENLANNKKAKRYSNLMAGTKIQRKWNDVIYEVEILEDGFEFNGQKFKSLSAIANKITGTRWNGPKFFKLREELL